MQTFDASSRRRFGTNHRIIRRALECWRRLRIESISWAMAWIFWRFDRIRRRVEKEPDGASYRDIATTPVTPDELESLELYHATPAAQMAVIKVQRKRKAVAQAAASAT